MTRVKQPAYSSGIMSEGMYARDDTSKYEKGLRDAKNVQLKPQGGVENRSGFGLATGYDTSHDGAPQYLIPFAFSTVQNYHLEFSDGVFRVLKDGGYVLDTEHSDVDVAGISAEAAARITLSDSGDAASFPAGCLAYIEDASGTHKLHGTVVKVTAAAGAVLSFTVYDNTELDTTTGDWGAVSGATLSRVYQQSHPYDLADMPHVRYVQDADTLYLAHEEYPPAKLARADHDDWVYEVVEFKTQATPPVMAGENTATYSVTDATRGNPIVVTVSGTRPEEGATIMFAGVVGMTQLNGRDYVVGEWTGTNSFELMSTAGAQVNAYTDREIGGEGGTERSYHYSTYASGGTISLNDGGATYGADVDLADLTAYTYVVSSVLDTGEESLPSGERVIENDLAFSGSINKFSWWPVEGAARYNVYKKDAGAYGYIGTTTAVTFEDENITADVSRGVQLDRNPFAEAGDYPAVVTFFEQRLAYGRTQNDPQLVEMSRVENVENFNNAYPDLPDDAFRFRMRAAQVNAIRAFIPMTALAIMTSGGEWEIAPQGDSDYVRPDKRQLSPVAYYGSYDIAPLLVGKVALFVEPSGNTIRDYRVGNRSELQGDLTILCRDLFEDREVTSWVYQRAPRGLVWVTLDNGELLTMTYLPEHDVWGWTRHELGGEDAFAHQVSGASDGVGEPPLLVVSRVVNGVRVTTTEVQVPREDRDIKRAYFLDGGIRAEFGEATSEVQGLLHLRGQSVTALVDGDVYTDLLVDNTGTVNIGDRSGKCISVGLPYDSLIRTLDIEMVTQGAGSTMGRYMSASEVAVRLERSRGVEVGVSLDSMSKLKEWTPDLIGGPIPLKSSTEVFSVDGDWVRNATVYVRQSNPLPMTLNAIAPEWEIGG